MKFEPILDFWDQTGLSPKELVTREICVAEIEFDLFEDFRGVGGLWKDRWIELVQFRTFCGGLACICGEGEESV